MRIQSNKATTQMFICPELKGVPFPVCLVEYNDNDNDSKLSETSLSGAKTFRIIYSFLDWGR